MSVDFSQIFLKLNESISENKIPTTINGVLSTRDERYGSVFGSWPGASPFSFKLTFGSSTQLLIERHVTNRLLNSASKKTTYPSCLGKGWITKIINASQDGERSCKTALLQNLH
jgi:hypothetical protein